MTNLRMDSIYIDYDFDNNEWKRPKIDMKDDADEIIDEANTSYVCFLNECKHRGISLSGKNLR